MCGPTLKYIRSLLLCTEVRGGIRSPGIRVTDGYEPPVMNSERPTKAVSALKCNTSLQPGNAEY